MEQDNVSIGIDFGTSYSCVGVWKGGRVEIIPNDQGNRITPSVVAFHANERLVGDIAKNQINTYPLNTVFNVKRLIGRPFDDAQVQTYMKHWPFQVQSGYRGSPVIETLCEGKVTHLAAEEVVSIILSQLKSNAEKYLGREVNRAVIAVPPFFSPYQRQAIKESAAMVGLRVLKVTNATSDAAVAFGLSRKESQHVLVFDLGGGTCSTAVVRIESGVVEVKATVSDAHLGGEDFDNRLVNYCVQEFKRKSTKDMSQNRRAVRRLKTACERAKRTLSSDHDAVIDLSELHDGVDFYTEITRTKFEDINFDHFHRCLETVEKVLQECNIDKAQIDEVLLIGGSSRIPKIKTLLSQMFDGKVLNNTLNCDEAVTTGAAIQAAILSGQNTTSSKLPDLRLRDVTSVCLGLETAGGVMTTLIKRNTSMPAKKTRTFTTATDNQTSVQIQLFEGERFMARDNTMLGNFVLARIPPMPRGVPQIEVTFEVDGDGAASVTVVEKWTGQQIKFPIVYCTDSLPVEAAGCLVCT